MFASSSRLFRSTVHRFCWLAVFGFLAATAQAQLGVSLQIKRRVFMLNEPVIATVLITNNSGKDIMLADSEGGKQWFSFQIVGEGRSIPPRNPNYDLQPLPIKNGETVKRSVNLNELYEIGEFGAYRATAAVYLPDLGKWFTSRPDPFDITEGRLIWKQTVGVPDSPEGQENYRTFSLLTMDQDKGRMLYVRIVGQSDGVVYGCFNLGRVLEGFQPDAKFDSGNNLAVLQVTARREYMLSRIGVLGNFISQNVYASTKGQPFLRKLQDGALQLVGAARQTPVTPTDLKDMPKLSDRPAGFPK